ncbi:MAG: CPBP family intramembrane glutamic endopeptidase, partial [Candidatus Tectomicrobia bacterium]
LLATAFVWQAWRPLPLWQMLAWCNWCLPMGLLAALLPILLIPLLESSVGRRLHGLRVIRDNVESLLAPLLGHLRGPEMLALSVLAGFSEEVFFRGVLQQEIGLLPSSLVFGLLHTVSLPYMLWAALVGLYLGWVLQLTQSLWVPIAAHSVIDLVGLCYIRFVVVPRCAVSRSVQGSSASC